jgi:sec-independent protein translocase protein TatB
VIDFNAAEILVLVVLAVIIFGPEKLPELARKLGRVFNYLRRIANDARGQLREQLGPEFDDLHLSDLTPRGLGTRLLGEEGTRDLAEAGRTASGAAAALGATIRAGSDDGSQPSGAADAAGDTAPERVVAFDPEAT